jgi:hypothetical protein
MVLAVQQQTQKHPSVLPRAQALALFDQEARRIAGMPGSEFLAKWDTGAFRDLDDTAAGREIAYLALLIPFGRQDS